MCAILTDLTDGTIVYGSDTTDPFDFGTTATHSCNMGFSLVGVSLRTCGGNGSSINGVPSAEKQYTLATTDREIEA